jgi:hypothetical protein
MVDLLKGEIDAKLAENPPSKLTLQRLSYKGPNSLELLWKVIAEDKAYAELCDAIVEPYDIYNTSIRSLAAHTSEYAIYFDENTGTNSIITFGAGYPSLLGYVVKAERLVQYEQYNEEVSSFAERLNKNSIEFPGIDL